VSLLRMIRPSLPLRTPSTTAFRPAFTMPDRLPVPSSFFSKMKRSLLLGAPVRFSKPLKARSATVPSFALVIDHTTVGAIGPTSVSLAEALPTNRSMSLNTPSAGAVRAARFTVIGPANAEKSRVSTAAVSASAESVPPSTAPVTEPPAANLNRSSEVPPTRFSMPWKASVLSRPEPAPLTCQTLATLSATSASSPPPP
jgi:hypothetical protein